MTIVNQSLRNLRLSLNNGNGISKRQFSIGMLVPLETYRNYEDRGVFPPPEFLERLRSKYGVDLNTFLFDFK